MKEEIIFQNDLLIDNVLLSERPGEGVWRQFRHFSRRNPFSGRTHSSHDQMLRGEFAGPQRTLWTEKLCDRFEKVLTQ